MCISITHLLDKVGAQGCIQTEIKLKPTHAHSTTHLIAKVKASDKTMPSRKTDMKPQAAIIPKQALRRARTKFLEFRQ
jgi:hypothetical protein